MSDSPRDAFLGRLAASLGDGSLVRLTLGKPRGEDQTLRNLFVRPVTLRGEPHLSFVWRHDTRDITKNHAPAAALAELTGLIGATFHRAHLFTPTSTLQLEYNKKGEPRLSEGKAAPVETEPGHDHAKHRLLPDDSRTWLQALGVIAPSGVVREGMADKHRQIHKFVELLSHLVAEAPALNRSPSAPSENAAPEVALQIADMGCGKGYLTFATHDYFNLVAHRPADVLGIEFRPALADAVNRIARDTGRSRLRFAAGTIQAAELPHLDVLIALHACDTATDDALARGIAAGAALLVVSPCCQKELRPQLTAAPVLAPALRHGIFQERHAEFATDALRALLLEWAGFDTKVFEFISTEHTARNLMIAALRRTTPATAVQRDRSAAAAREFAAFYGIRSQALARQLGFDLAPAAPAA